jgi:hypothetical protein
LASIVICSTFAKDSPEAQERLKDKLLYVALVLFAYSRALSMTG